MALHPQRPFHTTAPATALRRSLLLVALALMFASAACATVTAGTNHKLVADLSFKFFDTTAPSTPTPLRETDTVTCPQGQSVLAGGYNLAVNNVQQDWLATDLQPSGAIVDTNELYRPVPQLIRVVASQPTSKLDGWTIQLAGLAYPGADRKVAVYAYCVSGLSAAPTLITTPTPSVEVPSVADAECPEGTLVSGGGYTTDTYSYDNGQTAHVPIYLSAARLSRNAWEVQSVKGLFEPAAPTSFTAVGVCVSKQDFASETQPQVATIDFDPSTWTSVDIGGKTAYSVGQNGPSPCTSGALMLPAEYVLDGGLQYMDMRVDGVWEDVTLDHWATDLSVGRASSYAGEITRMDVYVLCLTLN